MNVLLIGGPSKLTNRLISSFSKEGHRVSVLTGSYHGTKKYERVFEQYNFPYTSNVLSEIFESVSPDITVFMGIYDSNFKWKDLQSDSVGFISAAMNILNSFSLMGKGRLLFLSSDAVFRPNHSQLYTEDIEPNASDLRGMTLIEAENLCEKFRTGFSADVVTVRLSGCYNIPDDLEDVADPVSVSCLRALLMGPIVTDSLRSRMFISAADSAYFLSQIAMAEKHDHGVYHLSSGVLVSEKELAETVNRQLEAMSPLPVSISQAHPGAASMAAAQLQLPAQALLDIGRFSEEFGINHLATLESRVKETMELMVKKARVFIHAKEEAENRWQRFAENALRALKAAVPYLENILCFSLIFILSRQVGDASYFAHVDLYLIYVILFALLYGQSQAAVSAFLSILGRVVPVLIDRSMSQLLLDYGVYVWIAQLFIVGLSVGYLKDKLNSQKEEAIDDHEYMTNQVDDIREINSSNSRVKDALEAQLINYRDSVGKIYDITSSLDAYNSVDVLFHGTGVICRIMDSRDVAVYVVHDDSPYARMFTSTSAHARQFGNSFLYQETGELYEALTQHRSYINRSWDRRFPAMAVGAYEGEMLRFIILVWTLPIEKMTLGQANLLTVVARLTQDSVMRARHYYEAVRHTQVVENTDVLLRDPFREMVDIYDAAAEKQLTEFIVLRVMRLPEGVEATAALLRQKIRPNDFIGLGLREDAVYVLVSNTSADGADVVIQRLEKAGLTAVNANHELI